MPENVRIRGSILERYSMRGRVNRAAASAPVGPATRWDWIVVDSRGQRQCLPAAPWLGALADGDDVTLVWLVPMGRGAGPYVALRNHTAGGIRYNDRALARLHRPDRPVAVAALVTMGLAPVGVGVGLVLALAATWYLLGVQGRNAMKESGSLLRGSRGRQGPRADAGAQVSSTTSQGAA